MYVAAFKIDDVTRFVWWQPDDHGNDAVVAADRRIIWFYSEARCRNEGEARGLPLDDESPSVQDFDLVLTWLAEVGDVPHESALNLWNFAGDVGRGTGVALLDHDAVRDRVYDKLFHANVPWVDGAERALPDWSDQELTVLRITLESAASFVRAAVRTAAFDQ
jgi:hypothetical protein